MLHINSFWNVSAALDMGVFERVVMSISIIDDRSTRSRKIVPSTGNDRVGGKAKSTYHPPDRRFRLERKHMAVSGDDQRFDVDLCISKLGLLAASKKGRADALVVCANIPLVLAGWIIPHPDSFARPRQQVQQVRGQSAEKPCRADVMMVLSTCVL